MFYDNDGIKIYYEIEGEGPEVIMLHGGGSNLETKWRQTGIADALKTENRLVLIDYRGHGKSDKPTDPAMYGWVKMLDDITNLMDHLGIEKANFIGYSLGSRLSLELLLTQPERVKSAILGAFELPDPIPPGEVDPAIERRRKRIEALLAESLDQIDDPEQREFRRTVELRGGDLKAHAAKTAALMDSRVAELSDLKTRLERIQSISVPLMTILGTDDPMLEHKSKLAMLVPNGCQFLIQGKGHVTASEDPKFHMVVRAFLNYVNGR